MRAAYSRTAASPSRVATASPRSQRFSLPCSLPLYDQRTPARGRTRRTNPGHSGSRCSLSDLTTSRRSAFSVSTVILGRLPLVRSSAIIRVALGSRFGSCRTKGSWRAPKQSVGNYTGFPDVWFLHPSAFYSIEGIAILGAGPLIAAIRG